MHVASFQVFPWRLWVRNKHNLVALHNRAFELILKQSVPYNGTQSMAHLQSNKSQILNLNHNLKKKNRRMNMNAKLGVLH